MAQPPSPTSALRAALGPLTEPQPDTTLDRCAVLLRRRCCELGLDTSWQVRAALTCDTVNAYFLPDEHGPLVVVPAGIFEQAPDDVLLGVLAHEVGHAVLSADGQQKRRQRSERDEVVNTSGAALFAALVLGGATPLIAVTGAMFAATYLTDAAHSRQCELAADRIGAQLVGSEVLAEVLRWFDSRDSIPVDGPRRHLPERLDRLCSTHPRHADRLARLHRTEPDRT